MRKVLYLLSMFTLLTAFMCEDEPVDEALSGVTTNPTNPTTATIVGDWELSSLDYNGVSETQFMGQTITANFDGSSANENYTLSLNSDGTFTGSGSYDITLVTTTSGISQTTTNTLQSTTDGTYTATATTFTSSANLIDIQLDGTMQQPNTAGGTVDYVLSNNGQTLTFSSTTTDNFSQPGGISVTISITNTSVFTRSGSNTGGGGTNAGVPGTWLLTAWNAAGDPIDLNNDGTPSTNLLDEMNCYTNETLVFNPDNSGTINSTSFADFGFDIVVGTTNQFNYTIDCIQENDTTNMTWSQTGNTVTISDSGQSSDWTLNGNQLSIFVPQGFVAFSSTDVTVTTTRDLTFVYTKQ